MAPNRKKRKPASNPARGFTTISVPSKLKAPGSSTLLSSANVSMEPQPESRSQTASVGALEQPELQQLSPDELQKHLEDAELQLLVEKYGTKCKNDSSRQVLKLETEKRILRPQASNLNVTDWLSPEILNEIMEKEKLEINQYSEQISKAKMEETRIFSEEELSIKLWTLRESLLGLGFTQLDVDEALKATLKLSFSDSTALKDIVWGLDQSLEWLGMSCDENDLPAYDKLRNNVSKIATKDTNLQTSNASSTPSSTGYNTSSDTRPKEQGIQAKTGLNLACHSSDESDCDPDFLVPKYVEIQTQLYVQQPDLFNKANKRQRKGVSSLTLENDKTLLNAAKLKKKLSRIENDILFDRDQAENMWQNKLAELRKDTAKFLRNAVAEEQQFEPPPAELKDTQIQDASDKLAESICSGSNENDDMLGGLFGADLEIPSAPSSSSGANGSTIIRNRDFGNPTGMNPRRVLEEACRARDISSASFSHRKEIEIRWSKAQDIAPQPPLGDISFRSDSYLVYASMASISTPTPLQAESYISTVALFAILSHSQKENKIYMKLPAVWRDLWDELIHVKKHYEDEVDKGILKGIQKLVQEKMSTLEEDVIRLGGFVKRNGGINSPIPRENSVSKQTAMTNEQLQNLWTQRSSTSSFVSMESFRKTLPIWQFKYQILDTLSSNQAIIICSETGSGKSTQVPSFILEKELLSGRDCKIYVTEPRRISAMSLAKRLSDELGEDKNSVGTNRSLVGYAIRLESKISSSTRLIFATTGVVVRMLERPRDFEDITHLVLDEVHERTIDSDFLLIILRRLMQERPDLKLVLMSATVDAARFSKYLHGAPVLDIPGRTFPVEVKYLEDAIEITKYCPNNDGLSALTDDDDELPDQSHDKPTGDLSSSLVGYSRQTREVVTGIDEYRLDYKLIVSLLLAITTRKEFEQYSKAILVFMPGMAEIRRLNDEILSEPLFNKSDWVIHALHSSIASEDQEKAFHVPPTGVRKIVIATNIAETGITIPDITAVIDTGKEKVMRFDEKRQLSKLVESFIARANAKQRRGRAGRVQRGLCFHLFTKFRHDKLLAEQQTPEILRLSLQDLILRVKICNLGEVEQTLSEAIDPPSPKNIRRAIEAHKEVKAFSNTENLTPLGRLLAKLPLDVFLGKLIIYGAFFKCLDSAVSIAAIVSSKSPFVNTVGSNTQRELAKLAFKRETGSSDLLTVYNAYLSWKRHRSTPGMSESAFCRKNYLSSQTLQNIEDVKMQLLTSIVDSGLLNLDPAEKDSLIRARFTGRQRQFFTVPKRMDINSENDIIVNSVIAWSFYPKLLSRNGKGWRNVANNQTVSLHPTSVNKKPDATLKWLSFYHIMQAGTRYLNAHETSPVEDFAIALLCGDIEFKLYAGIIAIDGARIRFSVKDWKSMLALKALTTRVRNALSFAIRNPHKELRSNQKGWVELWQKVFSEAKERELRKNRSLF
ncbi:DEAH box polypeptide 36 [Histoplasma capsulatum var. duboisii H88]|uniref:RNA helicase n=1 Tax=Ajellomyces capsulatus (strain H88) TaxID=544711 RepID=F0U9C1_AJEC8|nr:DEAH box polypeptide 36 [Histoplasma capsulatum var. duboisii H88]